ncbi:hypothetical protein EV144_1011444 [Flavobacterium sp. 270]|uniref:hypothetical protein n=1 Tax=Flavobacterium sp. 270 TaxID=2512114 RepID=UPI00106489E0|nr:hypothetical protein [Flavobacterium sp. 270]TDW52751.1 hypothetical protein EV144_1011444 [Flavobacterium sp. 270]
MVNYKDFSNFINEVNLNNVFNIKSELSRLIMFLNGEKKLINEAIDYATENSDFKFEEHIYFPLEIELTTVEDYYSYEKALLLDNFSEQRLHKVIELYHQLSKSKIAEETNTEATVNKKQIVMVTIVVVVLAAVAYKCLK